LVYHASGFAFSDVYTMPVYLRQFYLKELIDYKNKEKTEIEKTQKQTQNTPRFTIPRR